MIFQFIMSGLWILEIFMILQAYKDYKAGTKSTVLVALILLYIIKKAYQFHREIEEENKSGKKKPMIKADSIRSEYSLKLLKEFKRSKGHDSEDHAPGNN